MFCFSCYSPQRGAQPHSMRTRFMWTTHIYLLYTGALGNADKNTHARNVPFGAFCGSANIAPEMRTTLGPDGNWADLIRIRCCPKTTSTCALLFEQRIATHRALTHLLLLHRSPEPTTPGPGFTSPEFSTNFHPTNRMQLPASMCRPPTGCLLVSGT